MSGRIHKGQRVRVVVPRAVLRVGYPKTLDDYRGAWPEGLLDFVRVAADKCDAMAGTTDGREMTHALVGAVDTALAKKRARDDGYGGPARTVHTVEHADLAGAEGVVLALRTAYEGEYKAGRTRYIGDGGEEPAVWPPELTKRRAVRLCRVQIVGRGICIWMKASDLEAAP